MKILKILGIAAGLHALALLLIFANPGCSNSRAADPDPSPISAAPDSGAPAAVQPASTDAAVIRFSPTRPGTTVAAALATQPVSDVTPASTYTVARGDSLWSIASKSHLSKADLASANNLRSTSVLHVGQKLIIPAKAGQAPAPAEAAPLAAAPAAADKPAGETVKYPVKPGETLGAIARRYGVRQGDIAVANNITDPRRIQPGQELIIPAKAAGSKQAKASKAKADATESAAAPLPGSDSKPAVVPSANQDLDAGLKPAGADDVPVVKIEDPSQPAQPKNP